jgi:hypothetical protein
MLALAALTLSLQLQQSSFDLLDGVSIEVAAHNSAGAPAVVKFARPEEYSIQVLRGDQVIWTNAAVSPESTTFPVHKREFVPGPSVLVVYVWNGTEVDGSAPGPGNYTVHVRLLGQGVTPEATAKVHFAEPLPVSALDKLKQGDTVTIAGTLDPTKAILTDQTGSVPLGRRLLTAPDGPVAVRGYYLRRVGRDAIFVVQRWAPMQ